jgi:hypothetical protein
MVYSPVLLKVCQSGRNLSPVTTSGSEALVWPSDLPDVKGNTRLQITYRPVPGKSEVVSSSPLSDLTFFVVI